MTSEDRRVSSQPITRSAAIIPAAALLILLGIVFQLGELGYVNWSADNLWVLSVISSSITTLLDTCVKAAMLGGALRFWPLILVLAGLGILISAPQSLSASRQRAVSETRQERE